MDDALVALALIIISLLSWLFQKGGLIDKMRGRGAQLDNDEAELDYDPNANTELDEEERVRRFMEALGMPTNAPRPSRVEPRPRLAEPPPLPPARPTVSAPPTPAVPTSTQPSNISSTKTTDDDFWNRQDNKPDAFAWDSAVATPEAMRQRALQDRSRPHLTKAESDALARIEQNGLEEPWGVRQSRPPRVLSSKPGIWAREVVADRLAARKAILAQEILGQPRGLQSLPGPATIYDS